MIQTNVVCAIAQRQLGSFLKNPLGYLIILAFVAVSVVLLFFNQDFFKRNVADLGLIAFSMPIEIAVLLPLLAMSAWSTERELGTEELLLTGPASIFDAVLGKYLAVIGFYTIALACTLCNVIALQVLGSPDLGLIFANYVAWWFLGLACGAAALLGSVLVTSQVLSFVVGLIFSASVWALAYFFDLTEAFHRGVLALGPIICAVVIAGIALTLCVFAIASRRWRAQVLGRVGSEILTVILATVVAINVALIAQKRNVGHDVSVEGLATLSQQGSKVLSDIPLTVKLTLVVTDDEFLPPDQRRTAQELLDRAKAMERSAKGKIELEIIRPKESSDPAALRAKEAFGLEQRQVAVDTVAGRQAVGIFLGAIASAAGKQQVIPFFEPGLGPEYELVRAVRSVSSRAVQQEKAKVTVTIAIPAEKIEALDNQVKKLIGMDGKSGKIEELRKKDPNLSIEVLSIAQVSSTDGDKAKALGMKATEVKAGAIDAPLSSTKPPVTTYFGAVAKATTKAGTFEKKKAWLGDSDNTATDLDDLINKVRSLSKKRLPVLGVLETDLKMNGEQGNPMTGMGGNIPPLAILNDLRIQYEIRQVQPEDINSEDNQDVDVLLVGQASSLTQPQMESLATWIWNGHPTMILEDPMPFVPIIQGRKLAPSELKPSNMPKNQFGMQQPDPNLPAKGDVGALLASLGVHLSLSESIWCNFNPSHKLREWPKQFVWMMTDQGNMPQHPVNKGLNSALLLFPGVISKRSDSEGMTIAPFLSINPKSTWGTTSYADLFDSSLPWKPLKDLRSIRYRPGYYGSGMPVENGLAHLGVEIKGKMPYPYKNGPVAPGTRSEKETHVILISDTDMIQNNFFAWQINQNNEYKDEELRVLADLRNIQIVANCIDYLSGQTDLVALRSFRAQRRPLTQMENVQKDASSKFMDNMAKEDEEFDKQKKKIKLNFDENIETIKQTAKKNGADTYNIEIQVEQARRTAEAAYNKDLARLELKKDIAKNDLQSKVRGQIEYYQYLVRILALGIPVLVLGLMVVLIFFNKLLRERTDIPAARRRNA